jgi:toxin ParE1/3/4
MMMRVFKVTFSDLAEADIEAILDYVAENHSTERAAKLLAEFRKLADSLCQFPERGNVPKELESFGVFEFRQLIYAPYRLFYNVKEAEVSILLVADGRRDMQSLLRKRLLSR